MKALDLIEATGQIDDRIILEVTSTMKKSGNHSSKTYKKRIISFALAAALILALGTAAYAIGVNIHRQRQEELRRKLEIDENNITDYVEYPIIDEPEEAPAEGVTLLSTMNDGEFQRCWVVINGVTPEMIESLKASEQVDWEGRALPANGHRYCTVSATIDGENFFDTMPHLNVLDGYDPVSRTLTTECDLPVRELAQGQKATLRFIIAEIIDYEMDHSEAEIMCELGSVEVERTVQTVRTVWFTKPVTFENGAYGKGEILGAEISASGLNWILRHDGVSQMYRSHEFADETERLAYLELERSWLTAIEKVERGAVLTLSDGSSREVGLSLSSSQPEGGIVKDNCKFISGTINIDEVVSVTVGGQTFELE